MDIKQNNYEPKHHSILKSFVLSILPGVFITIIISIFSILAVNKELPHQFVVYIPTLSVILPFELGYLLYLGKKKNGKYSLKGIVVFQSSIPMRHYTIFVPVLTAWNFIIFTLMAPIEKVFIDKLFYWMPFWLLPAANPVNDLSLISSQYSKPVVIMVMVVGMILNGAITPYIEEMYFRGYLLPRLSCYKHWAPLLNVLFFSIYHIFSPWKYLTIFIALLPAIYIVWKRKCIYLTIITHILLNTIGIASGIIYLLFLV